MSTEHSLIPAAFGHGILSSLGPYANAAARRAASVTALDVAQGKVCLQTDTGELYFLASQSGGVPTWIKFATAADAVVTTDIDSLFPGAYTRLRGLTYGTTTLASGTSPPVGTLSGTISGAPVPIWFKCTTAGTIGSGAVFSAYADGLGTTPFMTGITPSAGTPVALTGVGAGLSHAWAAGTAATNNIWKATCASKLDSSGNNKHAVQATASFQPLVTAGLNGYAGILADGVDDIMRISALNLPAPGTTPCYIFAVARQITAGTNVALMGSGDFNSNNRIGAGASNQLYSSNVSGGVQVNNPTPPGFGNWFILECTRSNNASDPFKVGAVTATGNAGNLPTTDATLFDSPGLEPFGNFELLELIFTPVAPNWVSVRAAVTAKYGVSVAV